MTVLVTGAGGFAGSHLLELLQARGPVTGWTRKDADLLDRAAVDRAVAALKPTHVYHVAGSPHVAESWKDTSVPLAANIMATHHLLEALGKHSPGARVVVVGSATVYSAKPSPIAEHDTIGPTSPYAISKFAQEQLALRSVAEDRLEVIVARPFNHTGPRQGAEFAAASFAKQVADIERGQQSPAIHVGNLEAQRDLSDVRDVVSAYVALMDGGEKGQAYNVASGVGRPIRAVLDGLIARARVPVTVEADPARMRPHDIQILVGDASKLKAKTGWSPRISFDQMLDDLLAYWRTRPSA